MAVEHKLERVAPDDPHRCQASGAGGQCPYKSVDSAKFCSRHGGNKTTVALGKAATRLYRIQQYEERIAELTEHDESKKLDSEVGILRMTLENTLNMCKSPMDLMMNTGKIGDLAVKIDKLLTSCQRLQLQTNKHLDLNRALVLGQTLVEIIAKYVDDEDALDAIGEEIIGAIESAVNSDPSPVANAALNIQVNNNYTHGQLK